MGIIAKLKDALGIADRSTRPRGTDSADVAVSPEADAASERAVKGVETETAEETTTETADAGEQEPPSAESPESDDEDGEPVDAIKGIGASYAERLEDAGVHTVADLAAADAEELAEATGIGAGRIGNWIERAQVRNR